MNINISLSTESIASAIRKLERLEENFDEDSGKLVEILTQEGAAKAQSAYGRWNVAVVPITFKNEGEIIVAGDYPAMAEFGAGNATLSPGEYFENGHALDSEVWAGSYSLYEGTMDYYFLKHWKFGGKWYERVKPHLGLYKAKQYLIEHSTEIAQEVLQID